MAHETTLRELLDIAKIRVHREMVRDLIATIPASATVGEVVDALFDGPFREAAKALTLRELQEAAGGQTTRPHRRTSAPPATTTSTPAPTKRLINTRTRAGRAALDTAVRDHLITAGASRLGDIIDGVPGAETQVRQALDRLRKAGDVVGRGEEDTEFSVTASVASMSRSSSANLGVAEAG